MTIDKTLNEKTLTLAVSGRLDTVTSPELEASLDESLAGVENLKLDFANLEYISSSGLRVLLHAYKVMSKQGDMTVCNANATIQEIFELTGFSDFIKCS